VKDFIYLPAEYTNGFGELEFPIARLFLRANDTSASLSCQSRIAVAAVVSRARLRLRFYWNRSVRSEGVF
jgi:hypothetical protein